MRLLIVTGMSGAGKSTVLNVLEDDGWFCVDNLPIGLLSKFVQLTGAGQEDGRFAISVDIRAEREFDRLSSALSEIEEAGQKYEILFLDASDDVLLRRYKETRRAHPLAARGRIADGIALEREKIRFLREKADRVIDTSKMLVRDLMRETERLISDRGEHQDLYISIVSFGFKYGIPQDADLVFDVRFLPNPFYIDELRHKTGLDPEVQEYLAQFPQMDEFMERLCGMVKFLLPYYIDEGKHQLVIAVGCTGGQHRSVVVAERLYAAFASGKAYGIGISHREIGSAAAGT